MNIKNLKYEGFTLIMAFSLLFFAVNQPIQTAYLYFMFSGIFAGFFLSLLAYRRIKEYIIDEVIHLIDKKEIEAVKRFVKGLQ